MMNLMRRSDAMKEITLTKGKVAFVDDSDYEIVKGFHYYYHSKGYAIRWAGAHHIPKEVYLHHDIVGKAPQGFVVDHINGNKLDNRRNNLRFVTRSQNRVNSRKTRYGKYSKYRGAHFHKRKGMWSASIGVNGKLIHLGYFFNELEAALAYNDAANKYFGIYAPLNKIKEN